MSLEDNSRCKITELFYEFFHNSDHYKRKNSIELPEGYSNVNSFLDYCKEQSGERGGVFSKKYITVLHELAGIPPTERPPYKRRGFLRRKYLITNSEMRDILKRIKKI